jgi:hypothetical protein
MASLSRYQPVATYLAALPPEVQHITLTIDEIEALIGRPLADSARTGDLWSNGGDKSHIRALRRAGWRLARPPSRAFGTRVMFERQA